MRVLFVSTGDVCRPPLAAAALRARAEEAGLRLEVETAASCAYHLGERADPRALAAGRSRGYDLAMHRARRLVEEDMERSDYVLAMDRATLAYLRERISPRHARRLRLLLEFVPEAGGRDVPDPYYGGAQAFERALDLMEAATAGLLTHLDRSG